MRMRQSHMALSANDAGLGPCVRGAHYQRQLRPNAGAQTDVPSGRDWGRERIVAHWAANPAGLELPKSGRCCSLSMNLKVGRVTPCAPFPQSPQAGAHGVTRPTALRFKGSMPEIIQRNLSLGRIDSVGIHARPQPSPSSVAKGQARMGVGGRLRRVDPLPRGEGEAFPALEKIHRLATFPALPLLVSSPGGEHQGEGEPFLTASFRLNARVRMRGAGHLAADRPSRFTNPQFLQRWFLAVDALALDIRRFLLALTLLSFIALYSVALAAGDYSLGPESMMQDGASRGEVIKMPPFTNSAIYPGTHRDWWIYVPKQYDSAKPACVMVFQDGSGYASTNGQFRVPIVFDNLIHKKEMPITIGIFLNPGTVPPAEPGQNVRSNRSFEYDSLGDRYARFLLEEILPEVEKKYNLTKDPEGRAIGGISSGGICAWTVAWERPNEFRKVLSHVGSFTNIRGGHNYQAWIRKTANKPLRVFLQDGANDLDNLHGSWPLANQEMAASLKFKNYDYKFEFGTEGHNGKHGGAILPDSLRWLWRDYHP